MPLAKIHVLEGQYDEARLGKVSGGPSRSDEHTWRAAGRLLPDLRIAEASFVTRRRSWASSIRTT